MITNIVRCIKPLADCEQEEREYDYNDDPLLPCPFCGCDEPEMESDTWRARASVYCPNCRASTGTYRTTELAKEAWNRRA